MAKRSQKTVRGGAYDHLAPHSPRTLGTTRDGVEHSIPASNFRTLESAISNASVRSEHLYDHHNERTGKSVYRDVKVDVVANARSTALRGSLKLRSVTDGQHPQRRKIDEERGGCYPTPLSMSSALSGENKKRY